MYNFGDSDTKTIRNNKYAHKQHAKTKTKNTSMEKENYLLKQNFNKIKQRN